MTHYEIFGDAKWVKADKKCLAPSFKGTFDAKENEVAVITICGLGFFELFINGKKVSDDLFTPVNSHYHNYENCYCTKTYGEIMECRIYALQYDIRDYLIDGQNEIKVDVAPGWYKPYGECKLCFKIDFKNRVYLSDEKLKWIESPMTEYSITRGEEYDYTKENYLSGDVEICETPKSNFYIQRCPSDKVIRIIEPKCVREKENTKVYDLGENITGRPVIKCPIKGKEIIIYTCENYDFEADEIDEYWKKKEKTVFVCDGTDREYFTRFTWCAGRYLEIDKEAELLRFEVIYTNAPVTSSFSCSNEILNWLYETYIRTQLGNMHAGIPSDCPHIERRGYTGDGQLTCEAVMLMIESKEFYKKWMEDISDCQDRISGHIQYTAPYVYSGGGPGGWGCAIVEVPYVYYRTFNETEPLYKYFPQMLKYFEYLDAHSENDLIVSDQPGCWALGEWCNPGDGNKKKTHNPDIPNPLVNNYFYIKSLNRTIEIAKIIGQDYIIPKLEKIREKKIKAFETYFEKDTGNYANNGNCANAFALDLGLGDERTLKNLVEKIKNSTGVDTGIFGTDIVPRILFRMGYPNEAYRFMTYEDEPSFGFMKASGATTIWEEWNAPRSMFHPMFGALTRYLFNDILGIRQLDDSCGYEKIVVAPAEIDLEFATGKIKTINGEISVTVDRKNNIVTAEIPSAISAEFIYKNIKLPLKTGKNFINIKGE